MRYDGNRFVRLKIMPAGEVLSRWGIIKRKDAKIYEDEAAGSAGKLYFRV